MNLWWYSVFIYFSSSPSFFLALSLSPSFFLSLFLLWYGIIKIEGNRKPHTLSLDNVYPRQKNNLQKRKQKENFRPRRPKTKTKILNIELRQRLTKEKLLCNKIWIAEDSDSVSQHHFICIPIDSKIIKWKTSFSKWASWLWQVVAWYWWCKGFLFPH